jgi:hypothetical protein
MSLHDLAGFAFSVAIFCLCIAASRGDGPRAWFR